MLTDLAQESNNTVNLPEDDPNAVHAMMLEYLYTHRLSIPAETNEDDTLSFCVLVAKIADKYLISALGAATCRKFEERAQVVWSTKEFVEAMADIYSHDAGQPATDQLGEIALNIAAEHAVELLEIKDPPSDFVRVCNETPVLGTELATKLALKPAPKPSKQVTLKCNFRQYHSSLASVFRLPEETYDDATIAFPFGCTRGVVNKFSWWKMNRRFWA